MKKIRTFLLAATFVLGLSGAITAAAAQRSYDSEQMAELEGAVWKGSDAIQAKDCAFILSYQYENADGTLEGMKALYDSITSYAESQGYTRQTAGSTEGDYYLRDIGELENAGAEELQSAAVIVLGEDLVSVSSDVYGNRRFAHSYTIWQAQEGADGWQVTYVVEQGSYTDNSGAHPCYFLTVSPYYAESSSQTVQESASTKTAACEHVYEYVMEKEPKENEDGILAKKCEKCGMIAEYRPVSAIMAFLKNAEKSVKNAAQGAVVTVETDRWLCFDRAVMEAIASRPDVTVTVNYRYQHKDYTVTIPTGYDVIGLLNEEGFCGFRYLDLILGGKELVQ